MKPLTPLEALAFNRMIAGSAVSVSDIAIYSGSVRRFEQGPINIAGLRMELVECSWSDEGMVFTVSVPDRDTDVPVRLTFNINFGKVAQTAEELAELLTEALSRIIAHEIAERLFIRGRRRDPHAPTFDFEVKL